MVEHVEQFPAKFQLEPLSDRRIFHQGGVDVIGSRLRHCVPPQVSGSARWRQSKSARVEPPCYRVQWLTSRNSWTAGAGCVDRVRAEPRIQIGAVWIIVIAIPRIIE